MVKQARKWMRLHCTTKVFRRNKANGSDGLKSGPEFCNKNYYRVTQVLPAQKLI